MAVRMLSGGCQEAVKSLDCHIRVRARTQADVKPSPGSSLPGRSDSRGTTGLRSSAPCRGGAARSTEHLHIAALIVRLTILHSAAIPAY